MGFEWMVFCWIGKSMMSSCVFVGNEDWKMLSRNPCVSFLGDELQYHRPKCKIVKGDSSGWLFLGVGEVCKVR